MRLRDWTFTLCAVVALTFSLTAIAFFTSTSHSQPLVSSETRAVSLQHFQRIASVIQHPRCMNCHTSTDFPRQGDDGHPHIMQVKRGDHDSGTAALPCTTCHQKSNSPSGVPGNAVWHLAPLQMAWEGLSIGDICRSLTDPQKGGMTHEQLITHMATDHLVEWAWEPGVDLTGKPGRCHRSRTPTLACWSGSG